ncbi:glycerate kinase [Luteococcus sp. Sow4_B9]|uniref:glycerate kinase n=1 Tax=Luteococcus sp. Sow4_B9 TaxID=3438792 RepID=UPI003F979C6B
MRAVVACGPFKSLTSAQTGAAMARAWAELGAQLAVVPMGECGKGFGQAWSDLTDAVLEDVAEHRAFVGPAGAVVQVDVEAGAPEASTSAAVGQAVGQLIAWAEMHRRPLPELWLEIPSWDWADGGRGFHRAFEVARGNLASTKLHLVTTGGQTELHLTGLRGITSIAAQGGGAHPGELIAADQALVDWCAELGDPQLGTTAGAGAVGGLGAAVLALGGDIVTGPGECARLAGLAATMQAADLVVTGYDALEFGTKGGDLVPMVTGLAEQAMRPVVAVCRRNWISARELRTMGVEEGYGLSSDDRPLSTEEITAATAPVARTWHW